MRKKIMTLIMGTLLLLTACGQTGSNSASTMLPVAAVQSAAQAIAPTEDKTRGDTESPPTVETVEETQDAADEETPKPADSAKTPSGKMEVTPPPAAPKEPAIPAPAPEDTPAPAPTPAPAQKPAEKQEEGPTPEPVPAPEPKPEPADCWVAVEAANAYAAAQYGVITDGSLTMDNSAYRFPASVSVDASQEALEAKARDMVDYTFCQLMMQAGVDTLADADLRCNVCIVEDGASLLIYVLYAG